MLRLPKISVRYFVERKSMEIVIVRLTHHAIDVGMSLYQMTYEEALAEFNDEMYEPSPEAIKLAKQALAKAKKYKWHDLRNDPDDLPLHDDVYSVIVPDKIHQVFMDFSVSNRMFGEFYYEMHEEIPGNYAEQFFEPSDDEVIAWRELNIFNKD